MHATYSIPLIWITLPKRRPYFHLVWPCRWFFARLVLENFLPPAPYPSFPFCTNNLTCNTSIFIFENLTQNPRNSAKFYYRISSSSIFLITSSSGAFSLISIIFFNFGFSTVTPNAFRIISSFSRSKSLLISPS